jgi:regulatory protein
MGEADRAYEQALKYLEKRERTEREVYKKLNDSGFSDESSSKALERLREAGFVNDQSYASRYMNALAGKGRGRLRIIEEMRRKGLTEDMIRNTLEDEALASDELDRAKEAIKKALETIPDGMDKRKVMAKVNRRLVTLGYTYSTIGEAMNALRSDEREEDQ